MNIIAEKEEIIKRICEEQDESVIYAVKELLGNTLPAHPASDEALDRELDISISEADNGALLPYEEILAEFRKKYAA